MNEELIEKIKSARQVSEELKKKAFEEKNGESYSFWAGSLYAYEWIQALLEQS